MTSSRKSYVQGSVVSFEGLTDEPDAKWCCLCPSGPPPIKKVTECAIAPCDYCEAYGHKECYGIEDDDKTRRGYHYCVDCGDKTETTTNTHDTATDEKLNECMDPMPAISENVSESDNRVPPIPDSYGIENDPSIKCIHHGISMYIYTS